VRAAMIEPAAQTHRQRYRYYPSLDSVRPMMPGARATGLTT
jgi:hypothetical protein